MNFGNQTIRNLRKSSQNDGLYMKPKILSHLTNGASYGPRLHGHRLPSAFRSQSLSKATGLWIRQKTSQ